MANTRQKNVDRSRHLSETTGSPPTQGSSRRHSAGGGRSNVAVSSAGRANGNPALSVEGAESSASNGGADDSTPAVESRSGGNTAAGAVTTTAAASSAPLDLTDAVRSVLTDVLQRPEVLNTLCETLLGSLVQKLESTIATNAEALRGLEERIEEGRLMTAAVPTAGWRACGRTSNQKSSSWRSKWLAWRQRCGSRTTTWSR